MQKVHWKKVAGNKSMVSDGHDFGVGRNPNVDQKV